MPTAPRPKTAKPAARRPAGQARRPAAARPDAPPQPRGLRGWWRRVPAKELAQFTARLETLVNAGLPLVRALRILEGQQRPGPLKEIVEAVADDVEGGAPLSEALAKYPQVFDRLYVNMVRAGETGGVLGTVLERLAGFARKSEQIKGQIRTAMTYPVLVMVFAGGILLFTMTFVVPKFEGMFDSYAVEMPWITRAILQFSEWLTEYWYLFLAAPIVAVVLFQLARRHDGFDYRVHRLRLRLPMIGELVKKTIVARFTRTLGTLLTSGVPILEALAIVRASIPNRVVEDAVAEVHDAIREGETMARPLAESGLFDDMVINMIDVGEETGQLDTMLVRIAEDYENDIDTSIAVLFKALEPLMLLGVAVFVGIIAFALFLPMVRLMESFSGS